VALAGRETAARAAAEEHAEFAYAHLRGAREYIAQVLEPELRLEQERGDELRAQLAAEANARR
jgi:hypothetical protein